MLSQKSIMAKVRLGVCAYNQNMPHQSNYENISTYYFIYLFGNKKNRD